MKKPSAIMLHCICIALAVSMLTVIVFQAIHIHQDSNAYLKAEIEGLEYSLYNQTQYSIFLNDVLEVNGVETEPFQVYLSSYLYPNNERNSELHKKFIELGY